MVKKHGIDHQNSKKGHLSIFFVITLGFIILGLNCVQVLLVSHKTKNSIEQSYIEDCRQITSAYSLALTNRLNEYMNELNQYITADVVHTGDETQIVQWLRSHADIRSKDFDYVFFCGPDGIAYTDSNATAAVLDRDYFKAIINEGKEEYIANPVISKTTGRPIIHIVKAVKISGKTIGFFAGVVPLTTIQKTTGSIKLGESGYAWILANDGTVVAHQDTSIAMKKNFLTDLDAKNGDLTKLAEEMIKGNSGTAWVHDLQGDNVCVVYAPVEGTSWSFAFAVSQSQVHRTATELSKTMILTAALILCILLLISGFIIYRELKPLEIVEKTVNDIASGSADLTRRIEVKSKNEIGAVVSGFNKFSEKLQTIITELKQSKDELAAIGEDLHTGTQETATAITQILADIDTVSGHITNQSAGVEETAGAVNEIASNIASLERMIETQAAGVTEASAAVEEMIGNINSVNISVEKMAGSFSVLEQNARNGAEKQMDVNERIEQIEQESEMLQEANTAIASIANQTNLLAMNAAIEAAHAGEAGKGFSVVADEIRKLSETSSVQSKTIGTQLNKIKESITSVVAASSESSKAFNAVTEGIKNTDELVRQIRNAMEEQKEGSKQITETLHSMNDSTTEVRTASSEMSAGNKAILDEVKNLQESAGSMKDSMAEMSTGAKKINETGKALMDIAQRVKTSIQNIGGQVDQFKV
ncbi:MAG: methyl-accepting chemotaxis protein [Treponema sp.]